MIRQASVLDFKIVFFLLVSFLLEPVAGVFLNPASAQIPIQIQKGDDLNFGQVIINSSSNGSVTIDPAGNITVVGGGIQSLGGGVTAASYQVVGDPDATFTIDLPPEPFQVFANTNAGIQVIELSDFTSTPSGTGVLSPGPVIGTAQIFVGATATLVVGQPGALYGNNFSVFVDYAP